MKRRDTSSVRSLRATERGIRVGAGAVASARAGVRDCVMRLRRAVLIVIASGIVACGQPALTVPPEASAPSVVLTTYLEAFRRGDCDAAGALWIGPHDVGSGDLCGATHLTAFRVVADSMGQGERDIVVGTTLTIDGTRDGSLPAGETTWSFRLHQQQNGAWRIASGGGA
jgi:hypothetical protein